MKKLGILLLVVVSLVGILSTLVFADPRWGGPKMPGMGIRWNQVDEPFPRRKPLFGVTLTTEQKKKILDIQKKNLETIQNLHNQIQVAQLALQELSLKPTSPETAEQIRAKMKEIMNLSKQIQDVHHTMDQELLDLLTLEQLIQLIPNEAWGPYRKGISDFRPGPMYFRKRW